MLDVPVIRELYRYNSWANSRHVSHSVAHLSAIEFTRDLRSSYPSLRTHSALVSSIIYGGRGADS